MAAPDAYMIDYHPYRGGENPMHTYENGSKTLSFLKQGFLSGEMKEEFCKQIYDWLKKEINAYPKEFIIIAVAPGHAECGDPSGFMHSIVGELESEGVIHSMQKLIRTKTVPKQSQTPGHRDESTHQGTIAFKGEVPDNKGKVVIILDDVWTSGSTLRVCKKVMDESNPKEVKLFAIGKTN